MRIISGIHKGRRINPPKGFNSRPTTDFAKESLFNILENKFNFSGIRVLDLFSGSGNISLEFLSRGCIDVEAVELNNKNTLHIKKMFSELFPGKGVVIKADVYNFCNKNNLSEFEIIFADAPYNDMKVKTLPELIFRNESLSKAFLIIEHSDYVNFSDHIFFIETRRYGNVNFTFFKKNE
jgi:16S rRNA (guanine(966)-N(2))-methyltransferase RsmD